MTARTPRALIADDTLFFRKALSAALEEAGWEVIEAADGREALDCARRELPRLDLLVLDVEMPGRDGIDVLDEVRRTEAGASVAAAVLSGHSFSAERQERLRQLGVGLVLEKTVPLPELATRLLAFCDD